jgi:toxin secretion/phage lysis holin
MNLSTINSYAGGISAAAGVVITFCFGYWIEAFTFLAILIVGDVVSGIGASFKEGVGLRSKIFRQGFVGKGLMILVIIIANRADVMLGQEAVFAAAAAYFYIANELVSITENLGRAGVPFPTFITKLIDVLKTKSDVAGGGGAK